jgi:hypothetical protein
MRQDIKRALLLGLCFTVSACGGRGSVREEPPPGLRSGTHVLGIVARLYTREQVVQDRFPMFTSGLKDDLLASGLPESEIVDGSEVGVLTYCYAHNSSVSCLSHLGYYLAHASPAMRGELKTDSIVEIELTINAQNRLMGSVVRTYRDEDLKCEVKNLNYKGLASFSPLGPPQARWLECAVKDADGWTRTCVRGAPPTGPGGEKTCVFELQKRPGA